MSDAAAITCPACRHPLPGQAVLCVACGYDFRTGRRREAKITGNEIKRTIGFTGAWDLIFVFGAGAFTCLIVALAGVAADSVAGVLFFLPATIMASFCVFLLFANVAKVRITKDNRGQILLDITYLVFYMPLWHRNLRIELDDRLVMGCDVHGSDLFLLIVLLISGVVPGVLWWMMIRGGRTLLTIRNQNTGRIYRFSRLWDGESLRQLVDGIREMEPLPVDAG